MTEVEELPTEATDVMIAAAMKYVNDSMFDYYEWNEVAIAEMYQIMVSAYLTGGQRPRVIELPPSIGGGSIPTAIKWAEPSAPLSADAQAAHDSIIQKAKADTNGNRVDPLLVRKEQS